MIISFKMRRAAKIILINPEKKILLQLRDNKISIPYPHYWGCIGGEIDLGESSLEAIDREIKEEIKNAIITNIIYLGSILETDFLIDYFIGDIKTKIEEIILTEGEKIEYFKMEELNSLKMPPKLKDFIYSNKEKIFN